MQLQNQKETLKVSADPILNCNVRINLEKEIIFIYMEINLEQLIIIIVCRIVVFFIMLHPFTFRNRFMFGCWNGAFSQSIHKPQARALVPSKWKIRNCFYCACHKNEPSNINRSANVKTIDSFTIHAHGITNPTGSSFYASASIYPDTDNVKIIEKRVTCGIGE